MAVAALSENASLLNGHAFEMRWPGITKPGTPPPTNNYWGRAYLTTMEDVQASLAYWNGVSRFAFYGQLLIQIFSPISLAGGLENGNMFAEAIRDAFRRQSLSGWISFTNQQVKEMGNTDTHYITHVIVYCEFDNLSTAIALPTPTESTEVIELLAAATISAYFAVASSGANAVIAADSNNVALPAIGINTGGVVTGAQATIQYAGPITFNGWNWTIGFPVFVGPGGALTQTAPSTGYLQSVGYPVSPTTLLIEIEDAAEFG